MDNFKFLGNYDIQNWLSKLNTLTDEDWNVYSFRQDTYEVHKQTKTIPILYDEEYSLQIGKKSKYYNLFQSDVEELNKVYTDVLGKGEILRIEIVKMSPHSKVPFHIDYGGSLETHNRTHIPLQTNEHATYEVFLEDKTYKKEHMFQGSIWNINNLELHRSVNLGTASRTHIIMDFIDRDVLNILNDTGINYFHYNLPHMMAYSEKVMEILNNILN